MLLSSANGMFGGRAQANYTAGNTFKDARADHTWAESSIGRFRINSRRKNSRRERFLALLRNKANSIRR